MQGSVLAELYEKMRASPFAPDLAALWHDLGIVNAEDGVTFDNAAVAAAIPIDHHDSEILETGEWISATPLFVPYQLIAIEPATARRFGDETNGIARAYIH